MPTYVVKEPTTGRTVSLTGDSPPTEQELSDIFAKLPKATTEATEAPTRTWADTAKDVAIGAAKGLGNTAYGLGKAVHDYTPIGRISDAIQPGAFDEANKPPELTPTNAAQRVGQSAEQVAEFFLPTGAAGKVGKVAEVAKSGLLTLAQSGSPTAAGISAGLTAVIPGASAVGKMSGAMERSAQSEVARALGANKEWAKAEAAKLAPQIIKRGVGGSRQEMLDVAKQTAQRVGANLNQAYDAAAKAGETVAADIVAGNIQLARDALMVPGAAGGRAVVPGTERVVSKLNELADFVLAEGPDIPVDKAAHIKRTWDRIVSKAGLFGPKATASATDNADAWATKEASNSFRELLNTNPDIAALNKEAAFWTGLKKVLTETQQRTQAQAGTGLVAAGTGGAGAVVGAMSGDSASDRAEKAIIYGLAGRQLTKLVQSPSFRTKVSAPLKQVLADALASGSAARTAGATQRIIASLPAQLRSEFAN